MRTITWAEWPDATRDFVRRLKSSESEQLVLEENQIVEGFLVMGTQRELAAKEMERYRAPYKNTEASRQPTLDLAREIRIEGMPPDVCAVVDANAQWLRASFDVPKLFINGEPGLNVVGAIRDFVRSLPNQREITVPGSHFLQEDAPHEIGKAVGEFVTSLN